MEAGASIVTLENGAIRHVDAMNARGDDIAERSARYDYAANHLDLKFTEKGVSRTSSAMAMQSWCRPQPRRRPP